MHKKTADRMARTIPIVRAILALFESPSKIVYELANAYMPTTDPEINPVCINTIMIHERISPKALIK